MGLRDDILNQPVSELPLRKLIIIDPKVTVRQAVEKMRLSHLGYVLVIDKAGKPIGQFTERGLMRLLHQNPAGLDEPVEKHLWRDVQCVTQNDHIATVIQLMQAKGVRFVCVVDETGKAVGLTGQRGTMEFIAEYFPRQVKVQEMKSKLFMDHREGA